MILILSKSIAETSTNQVIEYLKEDNADFYRLNGDDFINQKVKIDFFINENHKWDFMIFDLERNIKIEKKQIKIVWFRRSFNNEENEYDDNDRSNNYLNREIRRVYSLFEIARDAIKWINSPSDINNKFLMLKCALDVGLNIPETIVTNNSDYIKNNINYNSSYITKSTTDGVGFEEDGYYKVVTTHRITFNKIKDNFFFPSLIQKEIKKAYEVRSFYLNNNVYSIAIFSQKNEKTELDFRNYDYDTPNRMSKYNLPKSINEKIIMLMKNLDLGSGSIDLIKGLDEKYYFLEINPVGQFGFTSRFGNYNLEKLIAQNLQNIDEN